MRKLILASFSLIFILYGCMSNVYLDGKNYYTKGQIDKSVQEFERINSVHWLCKLYSETGEYAKAVRKCEPAVNSWTLIEYTEYDDINNYLRDGLFTEDKYLWIKYLVAAYDKTGQTERASEVLEQYLKKDDPDNTNAFIWLSYFYNKQGKYDQTITAAKRAIELSPDNSIAYNNIGHAYRMKKQYAEAGNAFKKAIVLNPDNADYHAQMADLLYVKDDYAEAAEAYEKAVELQPSNMTYLFNLANLYRFIGKYEDALDVINRSITLSTFTGIGTEIGIVNGYPVIKRVFESGPAQKAGLLSGDRIIKIDGEKTKGLTIEKVVQGLKGEEGMRVVLTIQRKDSKKSLEKTVTRERIITAAASNAIGFRSFILRQMNKQKEALKEAKQAYTLNSSDEWAQLALGAAYLDQARYDESIDLLAKVKEGTYARILEATAYAKQGDLKKAVEIYSAISEEDLSPKNVPLWSDRTALLSVLKPFISSKIESADRLKAEGRYKEALNELGDALKIAEDKSSEEISGLISNIISIDPRLSELPEEARKYALGGDILTEEGKFEDAVKEYIKAVQAAPYIATLRFNIAMLYGELKDYPQAIRYMKTYLNLAPEAPNMRAAQDQIYKWEFMVGRGK